MSVKETKNSRMREIISAVIAVLFLIYSVKVLVVGNGKGYFGICVAIAIFFALLSVAFHFEWIALIPGPIKTAIGVAIVLGAALVVIVEGCILSQFGKKGQDGLDYLIVLGARYRDDGPSRALRERLNVTVEYLESNPDTVCIVTGGQGANEPCTEADGMAEYLIDKGIDESRIIREDQATNTMENIRFSRVLIEDDNAKIGIVTNNFHMFRAMGIARKQRIENVDGISAGIPVRYLPEYMFREFFGVLKDLAVGNM